MSILTEIQNRMKAPKDQKNEFGGFKYRSCEDILKEVKPLLQEFGCSMTITDEVVLIGERYYIKATATITGDGTIINTASAYAREPEMKKGMDASQISGMASSYARKYALGGLLLLDDSKLEFIPDADSQNKGVPEYGVEPEEEPKGKTTQKKTKSKDTTPKQEDGYRNPDDEPASEKDKEYIVMLCDEAGLDKTDVCERLNIKGKVFTKAHYMRAKAYLESHLANINDDLE